MPRLVLVALCKLYFDILALCTKMEVVIIFEFLAHCGDVDVFLWFGEVRSTENTIEGDHGKSFASAACKPRRPPYLHPGSPLNQRTRKCTSTTSTQ